MMIICYNKILFIKHYKELKTDKMICLTNKNYYKEAFFLMSFTISMNN